MSTHSSHSGLYIREKTSLNDQITSKECYTAYLTHDTPTSIKDIVNL